MESDYENKVSYFVLFMYAVPLLTTLKHIWMELLKMKTKFFKFKTEL